MDICPECGALIDKGYLECPVCNPEAYGVKKNSDTIKLRGASKYVPILDDAWVNTSEVKNYEN